MSLKGEGDITPLPKKGEEKEEQGEEQEEEEEDGSKGKKGKKVKKEKIVKMKLGLEDGKKKIAEIVLDINGIQTKKRDLKSSYTKAMEGSRVEVTKLAHGQTTLTDMGLIDDTLRAAKLALQIEDLNAAIKSARTMLKEVIEATLDAEGPDAGSKLETTGKGRIIVVSQ
jgi:hypothetical protein